MGLGQTLLSVLAMALLGSIVLGVNRNTADNGTVIERTEYEIMGTSLGISTVERATGLAFDENTVNADVSLATSCTPVASLGPEIGEVDSTFDDFDDYNHYNKVVNPDGASTMKTAEFHIVGKVEYAKLSGVDSVVTSVGQTFHKLLTIEVSSKSMTDTLRFQTVYSYWYFR